MTPAERQRRYRYRQRKGLRTYRVTADEVDLVEKLVAGNFLAPLRADDPEAQREALERMIADLEIGRNA